MQTLPRGVRRHGVSDVGAPTWTVFQKSSIQNNVREERSKDAEKGFGPYVSADGSTTCKREVAEYATLWLGRRGSAWKIGKQVELSWSVSHIQAVAL